MQIIEPSVTLERGLDDNVMAFIEKCGRTCYKSEANITGDSAEKFVRMLIKRGHESVLEHASATFRIVCDRGVMAEFTRHRLASFSIESTRYCDYSRRGVAFIRPCYWDECNINFDIWENAMIRAEGTYFDLRDNGCPPEEARAVLPLSLAAEMVVTANLREWRHILRLRTSSKAHPQMLQIADMIYAVFKAKLPVLVEDIQNDG